MTLHMYKTLCTMQLPIAAFPIASLLTFVLMLGPSDLILCRNVVRYSRDEVMWRTGVCSFHSFHGVREYTPDREKAHSELFERRWQRSALTSV